MRHNLGEKKLNKKYWSVFKEMPFAVMSEHLIPGLVLGISIVGFYLSVY